MAKDPIVEGVRRIREAQAAKHDFDVKAIWPRPRSGKHDRRTRLFRSRERRN